jgi:hypothetical protein
MSRAVTALLAFLAVVGLAAGFAGAALAAYDRSPAQQRGNEWADIGVALGATVAVSGGVAAVWALALLAIRLWPRRAARPSSPAH